MTDNLFLSCLTTLSLSNFIIFVASACYCLPCFVMFSNFLSQPAYSSKDLRGLTVQHKASDIKVCNTILFVSIQIKFKARTKLFFSTIS